MLDLVIKIINTILPNAFTCYKNQCGEWGRDFAVKSGYLKNELSPCLVIYVYERKIWLNNNVAAFLDSPFVCDVELDHLF